MFVGTSFTRFQIFKEHRPGTTGPSGYARYKLSADSLYLTPGIDPTGGARRDRTADLLRAKQALSQLSYGPDNVVGLGRFELPTSPLSGVRSNQLSYRPEVGNPGWMGARQTH